MEFDRESKKLYISVSELAAFAHRRENPTLLMQKYGFIKESVFNSDLKDVMNEGSALYSYTRNIDAIQTEVPLEKEIMCGEYVLCIRGYSNIISFDGILHTVEEIKSVKYFPREISPFTNPSHFAEVSIYAYLYAESLGLSELKVKLTYVKRGSGDKISFKTKFTKIALSRMFDGLIARAHVFFNTYAENHDIFLDECQNLPFPYKSIRSGQSDFIQRAYRTIRTGGTLLVSAPTGTGKTVSSLFSALKGIGAEIADKIFYFTSKTVTGRAAVEALEHLAKYAPHLRAIMICSKEQLCPYKKQTPSLNFKTACRYCDKLDDLADPSDPLKFITYRERQNAALVELLRSSTRIYTVERIIKISEKYNVCPTELSLDLSEYCSVIVCDYNYVVDEKVKFRRYFKNPENTDRFVFLFDEAHNLPDRTRNTYSAFCSNRNLTSIIEDNLDIIASNSDLNTRLKEYMTAFDEVREMCTDSEQIRESENGEIRIGYHNSASLPNKLISCAGNLHEVVSKLMREAPSEYEFLTSLSSELSDIVFSAGFFDEKFRFFAHRENDTVCVRILCIDPSGIIENIKSPARAVIMFSATMSPIEYYKAIVGGENSDILEISSPFERDNLCVVAFDAISTRLSDRQDTARKCAQIIADTISVRPGKYIVYFPSYDYMKRVCRLFAQMIGEDCGIVMQRQGMTFGERERFINLFRDSSKKFIVGFCVLGGMFSEGIDLAGESLIGVFIVGTGMPQLSAERNIMAAYYDEKNERGHDFAYTCPGMNKVLQAIGRVIRAESDRGIAVLIDDRYGENAIKLMFPPHLRHMKYTGDPSSLISIVEDFWDERK